MLPSGRHRPTRAPQLHSLAAVTSAIRQYLARPKPAVGPGSRVVSRAAMPEAAMNEHRDLEIGKDHVNPHPSYDPLGSVSNSLAPNGTL